MWIVCINKPIQRYRVFDAVRARAPGVAYPIKLEEADSSEVGPVHPRARLRRMFVESKDDGL